MMRSKSLTSLLIETRDGVGLFHRDWGTGPPVVFAAPWAMSSDWWEYQMAFLAAQGLRCIDRCASRFGLTFGLALEFFRRSIAKRPMQRLGTVSGKGSTVKRKRRAWKSRKRRGIPTFPRPQQQRFHLLPAFATHTLQLRQGNTM